MRSWSLPRKWARRAQAIEHHQGGRLEAARQIYVNILQAEPNHADALHLLGVIAHQAGYQGVVGFNLDGSHMEWQGVSVVQFIRELGDFIHCAHIKGVWVAKEHTRAGRLGGHREMRDPHNGWLFVTAGSQRDANSVEEIMIELNRVGYDGAVSIEWEDNDAEQHAGAKAALTAVRRADLPPSGMRHDEMLKA